MDAAEELPNQPQRLVHRPHPLKGAVRRMAPFVEALARLTRLPGLEGLAFKHLEEATTSSYSASYTQNDSAVDKIEL